MRLITLIPAYKTEYLAELFLGLLRQTYSDFQIVLSDDSPDGQITRLIRSGHFEKVLGPLNLQVVAGPRQGSLKNIQYLLRGRAAGADMVHIHLDDDVIYPDFYRAHVRAHSEARVGASVSLRWLTDASGRPLAALPVPDFVTHTGARTLHLSSPAVFASTVPMCANWLGETSNMVFSAEGAARYHDSQMADMSYYGLSDIGTLLNVSRRAPVALIRDHLSGFRANPQQSSVNMKSFALQCGHIAWTALALSARREGLITDEQTLGSIATSVWRAFATFGTEPSMTDFFTLVTGHFKDLDCLDKAFDVYWHDLLAGHSDSLPSGWVRHPNLADRAQGETPVPA